MNRKEINEYAKKYHVTPDQIREYINEMQTEDDDMIRYRLDHTLESFTPEERPSEDTPGIAPEQSYHQNKRPKRGNLHGNRNNDSLETAHEETADWDSEL